MKRAVSVFAVMMSIALVSSAKAETQEFSGKGRDDASGAIALAKLLKGHKLLCGPSARGGEKSQAKLFFPVELSATQTSETSAVVSITTQDERLNGKNAQETFGFGGQEIDPIEHSPSWTIVSVGDDGRRHLMVQGLRYVTFKDDQCLKSDRVDGNIAGMITEIWDAGQITSMGVQCCLE